MTHQDQDRQLLGFGYWAVQIHPARVLGLLSCGTLSQQLTRSHGFSNNPGTEFIQDMRTDRLSRNEAPLQDVVPQVHLLDHNHGRGSRHDQIRRHRVTAVPPDHGPSHLIAVNAVGRSDIIGCWQARQMFDRFRSRRQRRGRSLTPEWLGIQELEAQVTETEGTRKTESIDHRGRTLEANADVHILHGHRETRTSPAEEFVQILPNINRQRLHGRIRKSHSRESILNPIHNQYILPWDGPGTSQRCSRSILISLDGSGLPNSH